MLKNQEVRGIKGSFWAQQTQEWERNRSVMLRAGRARGDKEGER